MTAPTTPTVSGTKFAKITTPEGNNLYFDETRLKLIANLLTAGRPVALIGEPGSGKTELARAILAKALDKAGSTHMYQQEFGGIVSGDMLDGEKTLGSGGVLEIIPSEHLKAVRAAVAGNVVGYLLDEVNRGSAQGTNKLLRMYAQHEYSSDLDGVLKFDPKRLMSIATLNVGFGFTGTSRMDAALIDRFYPVLLEAPPHEVLDRILQDRFGADLSDKDRKAIVKAYEKSRASDDSYRMGVRDAIRCADGVAYGELTLRQSIEILVGGAVRMNNMDESCMESLVTVVSAA